MTPSLPRPRFVVLCRPDGTVARRLGGADAELPDALASGAPLAGVADDENRRKADAFLDRLVRLGAVRDWSVHVRHLHRPMLTYWCGVRTEDGLLVAGAPVRAEAREACVAALPEHETLAPVRALLLDGGADDEAGEGDVALYNELSRLNNELALAQRELGKRNHQLERLDEQKNYFIGMAAHELRNPLCSIRFYADYLASGFEGLPPEKRERFLAVIRDSSGFMARLIDDLLSFSRIESGRLELERAPTDLAALVRQTVEIHALPAAEKGIRLEAEAPSSPLVAAVDEAKLGQVLDNLLMNAVKFCRDGDRVCLRARSDGEAVVVDVEDTGPGIPADEQAALFEPFRTASVKATAAERSTGLGLAISRSIVEGHGGRIELASTVGEGTTFSVRLPVEPGERVRGVVLPR